MSTDDINPDIIAEFEVVRTKMTAVDADAYFEVRMIDRMSKSAAAAERTAAAVETISEAMRDDHDEIAKIASVSKSIATVGERAAVSAGRSADAAIVIAAAVERISQHVGQIASSEIAPALTTIATAVDRMAIAAQAVEQIAHDVRAGLQAAAALAEEFGPTARRAARQVADLIARYAPPPSRKR
jgi:methyl-accepting chemotaxis protein